MLTRQKYYTKFNYWKEFSTNYNDFSEQKCINRQA